jgi:exosortase
MATANSTLTDQWQTRIFGFLGFSLAVLALFWRYITPVIQSSFQAGYSSHIVLVPLITGYLLWRERRHIFHNPAFGVKQSVLVGIPAIAIATFAFIAHASFLTSQTNLMIFASTLLLAISGFLLFFGYEVFKRGIFPILLLGAMLPLPASVMDLIIHFLQAQSANLSEALFSLIGVPVLRNGFYLTIPGITVEVARECSGINSSVALLITVILIARESLRTTGRRLILVLLTIPFSILKNAVRIVTLTVLATRVDPSFLSGRLHQEGGFVFFVITLALFYPIWKILRNSENSLGSENEKGTQGNPATTAVRQS